MSSPFDPPGGEPPHNPYASPSSDAGWQTDAPETFSSMLPHRGTLILTLGLLGMIGALVGLPVIFCCPCLPIGLLSVAASLPAAIMGNIDLKAIQAGAMDPQGRGTTQAGRVCGIIGVVIAALTVIGYGTLMIIAIVFDDGAVGGNPFEEF